MKDKSELRRRISLCEKSMVLVANIIKLSSISLGKMSCGTTTTTTIIRSVQTAEAHSRQETNAVVSSSSTAASTKVLLDSKLLQRPRKSQEMPQEPAAVARDEHHPSKPGYPAKVTSKIPHGFTTVTTPSAVHVKRDHQVPPDDVDGRAEDFIRRKKQIINGVNSISGTSTTTGSALSYAPSSYN